MQLRCVVCAALHPADLRSACASCGDILEVIEPVGTSIAGDSYLQSGMWRHAPRLSVGNRACIISLREGETPLHRAGRLARALGFAGELWIKDETVNPSGSFKDRLISAAISRARELGAPGVVCASSGNAGASTAAYAARAGMPAVILVPARTPDAKLAQIRAHGARLEMVDGHYSNAYKRGLQLAASEGFANLTTTYLNPYGVDALRLIAWEILGRLGQAPTHVLVPTGAGPLVKGIVQGFREATPGSVPRAVAVQAEGCAPIAAAFQAGATRVAAWGEPRTIASGISDPLVGYERDGTYTLRLVRETNGLAIAVSDAAIRAAMTQLARCEGILAEPTGASSVAAVRELMNRNEIDGESRVVCMVTGHGFKDMQHYQALSDG